MGWLFSILGRFFGAIFRELIPGIWEMFTKPLKVRFTGADEDLRDDMDDSIEDGMDEMD